MLGKLGFCDKWIGWIKEYLQSLSFSVLVNGSPTFEFKSEKGLRQGVRLALFLYLIVVKGLVGFVRQAQETNLLESILVGKNEVPMDMLQFVDDTFYFCRAMTKSVLVLKAILRCFELSIRLKVK